MRFHGMAPMVGYRDGRVFHVLWLDYDLACTTTVEGNLRRSASRPTALLVTRRTDPSGNRSVAEDD